ncbi:hypothetical protein TNCV_138261 [Trichonephila clavipes]|nr:hypothetical protein TNCV_138261 [Trichonephila clavipes]
MTALGLWALLRARDQRVTSTSPGIITDLPCREGRFTLNQSRRKEVMRDGVSIVFDVADSRLECHDFETSTVKDPTRRRNRCTLNMLRIRSNSPEVQTCVVWLFGQELLYLVSPLSLD